MATAPPDERGGGVEEEPASGLRAVVERLGGAAVGVTELMRDLAWVRRARPLAVRLACERDYAAVVVTSPRHLAGADVAEATSVPYVADYRDPWVLGRGEDLDRLDPVTRTVWGRAERCALRCATLAVDISRTGPATPSGPAAPPGAARSPHPPAP